MDLTRHPASLTTPIQTTVSIHDRLRPHPFHHTNPQIAEAQTPRTSRGSVGPNTTTTPTTPIGVTETTRDTPN